MRIAAKVLAPCLVVRPKPQHLEPRLVLAAMKQDKKRIGEGLVCIMMKDDYDFIKVDNLGASEIDDAVDDLGQLLDTLMGRW